MSHPTPQPDLPTATQTRHASDLAQLLEMERTDHGTTRQELEAAQSRISDLAAEVIDLRAQREETRRTLRVAENIAGHADATLNEARRNLAQVLKTSATGDVPTLVGMVAARIGTLYARIEALRGQREKLLLASSGITAEASSGTGVLEDLVTVAESARSSHRLAASGGRLEETGPMVPHRWVCSCGEWSGNPSRYRDSAAALRHIDRAMVRAVSPVLVRRARQRAADDILAYAEQHAPAGAPAHDGLRWHLHIAARIAAPSTPAEVRQVIAAVVRHRKESGDALAGAATDSGAETR